LGKFATYLPGGVKGFLTVALLYHRFDAPRQKVTRSVRHFLSAAAFPQKQRARRTTAFVLVLFRWAAGFLSATW
jgi:hypothetical protein